MKVNLTLDISGSVDQTIQLNKDCKLTQEEFVQKFKAGQIVTSICHGENNGMVYEFISQPFAMKEIGQVILQESLDDMSIELVEDKMN